jgi:hypothetical protein
MPDPGIVCFGELNLGDFAGKRKNLADDLTDSTPLIMGDSASSENASNTSSHTDDDVKLETQDK